MTPIRGDGLIRAVWDHAPDSADQYEREAGELERDAAELRRKAATLRALHAVASLHAKAETTERLLHQIKTSAPCGDAA